MVTTSDRASARPEAVVVRLPAELRSVSEARSLLTETAMGWGCTDDVVGDARVVLSELMSNGVLHARTEIQLVLVARPKGGLRMEVHDLSPSPVLPPLPANHNLSSLLDRPESTQDGPGPGEVPTTGRGLALVSALSAGWGWFPDAAGGKTVWADLGPAEEEAGAEEAQRSGRGSFPVRPVRVIAVPVRLLRESEDHFDDLFRELQMAHLATGAEEAAARLAFQAEVVRNRLVGLREPVRRALWEALRRGDRLIDLNLLADTGMPAVFEMTERLLQDASAAAKQGLLLTEGPPHEVNEWRRWLRAEMEEQIAGKPPRPCPFPVTSPLTEEKGPQWERLDAARRRVLAEVSSILSAPGSAGADGSTSSLVAAIERTVASMGARRATLNVLDEDNETVRFVAPVGFSSVVSGYWSTFPVSADLPSSEVIRTGRPALFRTFAEMDERYPVFLSTPSESDPAVACMPLVPTGASSPIGSFVMGFARARDFIPTEVSFLGQIATTLADFLAGQRRQGAMERASHRQKALAAASVNISGARDRQVMVGEFLGALVSLVADAAALHLLGPTGQPEYVTARHRDPERQAAAHHLLGRRRPGPPTDEMAADGRSQDMVSACALTGETTVIQVLSEEMVEAGARDAEAYDLIRKLAIGSVAVLPLRSRGRLVGVVSIAKDAGRYITEEDLTLTSELADHLGEVLTRVAG